MAGSSLVARHHPTMEVNMKKTNPLADQVSSLLKITGAKLKQAKEAEPADLGSTVIRECLSALNSATAILDRLESEELAMAPPVGPQEADPSQTQTCQSTGREGPHPEAGQRAEAEGGCLGYGGVTNDQTLCRLL